MILLILANFEYLCEAYYARVHLIASIVFYQMMQCIYEVDCDYHIIFITRYSI